MDSTRDSNVKIIPFCVPMPSSSSLMAGDAVGPQHASDSGFGIVGTITLRGKSAVVWFGWGAIESCGEGDLDVRESSNGIVSVGSGKPSMGSLALSMPPLRTTHQVPTTHLLGGSSEEDMLLGQQISARLAKRVGWPIFVSCSFSGCSGDAGGGGGGGRDGASNDMTSPALSAGYDDDMSQHAAALAEREVSKILLSEKSILTSSN